MLKYWTETKQKALITSHVPSKRRRHSAVLYGDFLYILGGFDGQNYLSDFHCYNFYTNEWLQLESIDIPLCGHTASVYKDKLYVFGGYDGKNYLGSLYEYDFTLKKWNLLLKDVKNLTDRAFHSSVIYKDKMYIFGGYNLFGCRDSSVWEFSFKQKIFTKLLLSGENPPPYKRRNHTAVVYKDSMYIFGGFSDKEYFNDFFRYEFLTRTWTEIKNHFGVIPTPRAVHTAVVENHLMYIVGGYADEKRSNNISVFNFITYEWIKLTPLNNENKIFPQRGRHSTTIRKGKMYIFGGTTDLGVNNELIELDITNELKDEGILKCLNQIKPDTCIEVSEKKFYAHSFILSQSFVMESFLKGVMNVHIRRKRNVEVLSSNLPSTTSSNNFKKHVRNISSMNENDLSSNLTSPRSSTTNHSDMKEFSIRDTSPEIFLLVLQYLYGKIINIDKISTLVELCRASESYKLNNLRSICLQQFQKIINEQNYDIFYQIVSKIKFTTLLNYLDVWKEKFSKIENHQQKNLYQFIELSNPEPLYNIDLKKKLVELHETKENCDLIIISKDKVSIACHSYILSSTSDYFFNLFLSNDESTFQIELQSDILRYVFEFLYTNSINFPSNIILEKLIFLYQISDTVVKSTEFKEFMFSVIVKNLSSETILDTIKYCMKYFIKDRLYDYCLIYIETTGKSVLTKYLIESTLMKNELPFHIREPTISKHKKMLSFSNHLDLGDGELDADLSTDRSDSYIVQKEKRSFRVISFSGESEDTNKIEELELKIQSQELVIQQQYETIDALVEKQKQNEKLLDQIIEHLAQKE
eukprot:gene2030-1537_t